MKSFALCFLLLAFATRLDWGQTSEIDSQLAAIDNAAPGAPILKTPGRIKESFEGCMRENQRTEFDTAETLLARVAKAPCRFGGMTTFRGRGDELAGDVLHYDAEREVVYWDVSLQRRENLFHGLEGASPYDLEDRKAEAKGLSGDQKKAIKAAGNTDYLLLPLQGDMNTARSYEANNAFGAKREVAEIRGIRYSIAVNIGSKFIGYGEKFRVAAIPLQRDKAANLMPHIDVKLYWIADKPCTECFSAGTALRGNEGPTFSNPSDIRLLHNFVFAKFVAVRLVDRRDGTIIGTSTGK